MDVAFTSELESIFREEFLKAAPLYQAAGKVKLPFEDLKGPTVLYRGSLSEESRPVQKVADYALFRTLTETHAVVKDEFRKLAESAGHVVDGLIRLENVREAVDQDPRNTTNLKVTDIFEHADGRRNLDIGYVQGRSSVEDPCAIVSGWVFYKFYFAVASIKMAYKQ